MIPRSQSPSSREIFRREQLKLRQSEEFLQEIRKSGDFSFEAAEFSQRALIFLEEAARGAARFPPLGNEEERLAVRNKLIALMAAFDSGELHELYEQQSLPQLPNSMIIGHAFEVLAKNDPANPLSLTPTNRQKRDPESENTILTLMQHPELLPGKLLQEKRVYTDELPKESPVKNPSPRFSPPDRGPFLSLLTERTYQLTGPRRWISNPDQIVVQPAEKLSQTKPAKGEGLPHHGAGVITALAEIKASAGEALKPKSQSQLQGFYNKLAEALEGNSKRPGINAAVTTLREDFGLFLPEKGFYLVPEEELKKSLILPADEVELWEKNTNKLPSYQVVGASFTRAEVEQLALKFFMQETDLSARHIPKRFTKTKVEFLPEEEVSELAPEVRNGPTRELIPALAGESFAAWIKQIDASQAEIDVNQAGYCLIKLRGELFPGDTFGEENQPIHTKIIFFTPSRKKLSWNQLKAKLLNQAHLAKAGGLFVSVFHDLQPEEGGPPSRMIGIALGEKPARGPALAKGLTLTRDNEEPIEVENGSFILGNYQWGHPEADLPKEGEVIAEPKA